MSIIVRNRGNKINIVHRSKTYNIHSGGRRGLPGAQGEQGIPGEQGEPGTPGVVQSIVGGTNITVDDTDPSNPIVSASGGGAVDSVNGQTGVVVLDTDDIDDTSANRYTNDTDIVRLANTSGTNTGDQTLAGLGGVPTSRTINGQDLSANRTFTQDNIGDGTTYRQYSQTEKTKLAAITGTNTGDQTATTTPNTPAGGIAATNVQAALNELDTEKAIDADVVHKTGNESITGVKTFDTAGGSSTSGGFRVTGSTDVRYLTIEGPTSQPLTITDTRASSSALGAGMAFGTNDGAAMASGDRLAYLLAQGYDGAATRNGAQISFVTSAAWSSNYYPSYISFRSSDGTGASQEYMSIGGLSTQGIVINELGRDKDTRIEGDTDQNLVFVDASTDRVGIGTATPSQKLDVVGNIAVSGTVDGRDLSTDGTRLDVITDANYLNSNTTKAQVGLGNVDNTSDVNKPVSTAQQTALNLKANLASPNFTGNVTVPNPSTGTDAVNKNWLDLTLLGGYVPLTTYNPALLHATGFYGSRIGMNKWRTSTRQMKHIMCWGDSVTQGTGVDAKTRSYSDGLRETLTNEFNEQIHEGFQPMFWATGATATRYTTSGGWTSLTGPSASNLSPFGLNGANLRSTNNTLRTITWTRPSHVKCTRFYIYWVDDSTTTSGSSWSYSTNGGSTWTSVPTTSPGTPTFKQTLVTGVDDPTDIRIRNADAAGTTWTNSAVFMGLDIRHGEYGWVVHNVGGAGASLSLPTTANSCGSVSTDRLGAWNTLFDYLQPELVIIEFSNDTTGYVQATFETAISTACSTLIAYADLVAYGFPDQSRLSGGADLANVRNHTRTKVLQYYGVAVDMSQRWVSVAQSQTDLFMPAGLFPIHPTALGDKDVASAIARLLRSHA